MSSSSASTRGDARRLHIPMHSLVPRIVALCLLALIALPHATTAQAQQPTAPERPDATKNEDALGDAPAPNNPPNVPEPQNVTRDTNADDEKSAETSTPSVTEAEHEAHREADNDADAQPPIRLPRIFFNHPLNSSDYGDPSESEAPPGLTVQERHDETRTIRRRYALFTQRNTKIQFKKRSHELDDELHSTLEVLIRFRQDDQDTDRMDVTVLRAEPHVSQPASPLSIRVPSRGLNLHCWQRTFEVQCIHATTGHPVAWPQWATLDLNDWLPRGRIPPNARWQRSLSDPRVVGWLGDNSHQGHIRASMEITENGGSTSADAARLEVQGVIGGDGELKVYHRRESFPINGELDMQFDHTQSLLNRFALKWDGGVNVEGLLSADKYRWARQTHTTLRVTSSLVEDN